MPSSIWRGHVGFGLVSFPVRLQAAAHSESVSFHQLHQCDHSRVRRVLYVRLRTSRSRATSWSRVRIREGCYVGVEPRELDQIAPRSSRVMEVLEFVPLGQVDPIYLGTS